MNLGVIGRLRLRPGRAPALACERPLVGGAAMQRLVAGVPADRLPDRMAALFTLCAGAQRLTAQRAIAAACGRVAPVDDAARLRLRLDSAREHLQRWALDLPAALPVPGADADPRWLAGLPVTGAAVTRDAAAAAAALPGWLAQQLFGAPPAEWLARWRHEGTGWLARWTAAHAHPVARWLAAVRDEAQAFALPCRPLGLVDEGDAGWRALAAAVAADADFAAHPTWRGQPAETGAWTRSAAAGAVPVHTLWDRLGARLAELAALAVEPAGPAAGAVALGAGAGLAWTETARGLLVHAVHLAGEVLEPLQAHATIYRVIAPTDWNFHPDGTLGRALARPGTTEAQARLAAAVLDPCVPVEVEAEVEARSPVGAGHA